MRLAFLVILPWLSATAQSLQEVRQRGTAMENQQRWEEAAEMYRSALTRLTPSHGRQDRIWLLTSLMEVAFERQNYSESHRWLRQAEVVVEDLGPAAPERIRLLNATGALHLVEGNLTAAQHDLSRAVELSESVAAPLDLAAALHSLAAVEMQIRDLDNATLHEIRALSIWRRELGDSHRYVMKALISLSSLQGLCGDWHAAERSLQNALAIAETPEALANYAFVLDKLKRGREAKAIRRRLHLPIPSRAPLIDLKAMAPSRDRVSVQAR